MRVGVVVCRLVMPIAADRGGDGLRWKAACWDLGMIRGRRRGRDAFRPCPTGQDVRLCSPAVDGEFFGLPGRRTRMALCRTPWNTPWLALRLASEASNLAYHVRGDCLRCRVGDIPFARFGDGLHRDPGDDVRGSPRSVETSVVVIVARAGCPWCARVWPGQAVACPLFLFPGAAGVPGVQGGPQGRRPQGDAEHPGGRGGGPVRLAGAARTAAAQPPPLCGPRSGPAAVTWRPFPSGPARNPRG